MNPKQQSYFKKILNALKKELSRDIDRERKLIKKIDEAIARIDTREYGECKQ